MASQDQQPVNEGDTDSDAPELPAIVAAFLVIFDERKGYTIAWQRSDEDLDLDGVVEFKSMPSGLHNVKQDLVYFVYEDYAGISAVLNVEDQEAARKVRVIAVGVLVPLEHGRMGKSWLHAESLQVLAEKQVHKGDDYSLLEEYWDNYRLSASPEPQGSDTSAEQNGLGISTGENSQPAGYRATRSMSTATVPGTTAHVLPLHHPALMLPEFIRLFGPLVFPLFRAALLRKRIIFLASAPVERTCNFVYNLSILSSLPKPIVTLLPDIDPAYARSRPLFNVGVSDIPFLESESKSERGWIACTTDDVICTKPNLFDVLVILPSAMSKGSNFRPYPKLYFSSPELIKARPKYGLRASQRDAKRFANISSGLKSIPRARRMSMQDPSSTAILSPTDSPTALTTMFDPVDTASILSTASSTISQNDVVEPSSWSRIAYTSLLWWASAGDNRTGLTELEQNENEQDIALLTGENLDEDDETDQEAKAREVACVQYFHRLTNMMFTALSECVRRVDGQSNGYRDDENDRNASDVAPDDNGEDERALLPTRSKDSKNDDLPQVDITQEDMQSMGLDVWSQADRQFVEEMTKYWFDRKANVQSGRIECCGVRIM